MIRLQSYQFYKKVYRVIGTIILAIGLCIIPLLPYIIKETVSTNAEKSILYVFFVIIRRVALVGWAQYWYILVFAEGIIILSLILRYQKYKLGWLFCICGLALNVVYRIPIQNGFCNLLNKGVYFVFSSESNVVMTGFPLLSIYSFP